MVVKSELWLRIILDSSLAGDTDPPTGSRFHTRCLATVGAIFENEDPVFAMLGEVQRAACHGFSPST
jgi:hypothetical protein